MYFCVLIGSWFRRRIDFWSHLKSMLPTRSCFCVLRNSGFLDWERRCVF